METQTFFIKFADAIKNFANDLGLDVPDIHQFLIRRYSKNKGAEITDEAIQFLNDNRNIEIQNDNKPTGTG